jgi:PPK2 family polyphosphate:nucleotide phosphotransferase
VIIFNLVRMPDTPDGTDEGAFASMTETQHKIFMPSTEVVKAPSSLYNELLVEPGGHVDLKKIDPAYHGDYPSNEVAMVETQRHLEKMAELQYLMYAEQKHALLIVLQGMDAAGKDGIIRLILSRVNPAGCRVVCFKQPTAAERSHDFLWRVHPTVPARGEIAIFNRSHYEDVLVVRVHQLVPAYTWGRRYDLINSFEKWLVLENNTKILKFFLYISPEEQLMRFKERLDDPTRHWKISESDYREREYWDDYVSAFEDMLHKTSTSHAPWFVIPSDHKWFRDLTISQIISSTLDKLNMKSPRPKVDVADIRRRYHAAKAITQIARNAVDSEGTHLRTLHINVT